MGILVQNRVVNRGITAETQRGQDEERQPRFAASLPVFEVVDKAAKPVFEHSRMKVDQQPHRSVAQLEIRQELRPPRFSASPR